MLFRKMESALENWFQQEQNKILLIDGARQVGKTYLIRQVGKKRFENYIEINLLEDSLQDRLFETVRKTEDFYLQVSMLAGGRMREKENTLIFLDEIQAYPELLTLLKFLKQEDRYTYIASGSLLGVTLAETSSIPIGSIETWHLYPLDFEEFLIANGFGALAIEALRGCFAELRSPEEAVHRKVMDLFRKYLLVGGLPDAVNAWLRSSNIVEVRAIQREIRAYYGADASKYDGEHRLKIRRIYEMIPSTLENRKKRVVVKDIEGKKGKRFSDYQDEFDYLIAAGIALEVHAVPTPVFPLDEAGTKNLLKLYLNDVGLLTEILYRNNIRAVMDDEKSVNLGSVYESVVAQELKAHGKELFYYDNRDRGEVDYLINDYEALSAVPIEVKSGKDYTVHSALTRFLSNEDYHMMKGYVLSNAREIREKRRVIYLPVYMAMFLGGTS